MDTHTGQHWLRRGLAFFLILTLLLSMSSVGVFAETNENEKTPVFTKNSNYRAAVTLKKPSDSWYSSFSGYYNTTAEITTGEDTDSPLLTLTLYEGMNYDSWEAEWFTDLQFYQKDSETPIKDLTFTPKDETSGYNTVKGTVTFTLPYLDESGSYKGHGTLNSAAESDVELVIDWSTLEKVLPAAKAPVIKPAGGEFEETQTVTLESETENAVILYTLDGTDPAYTDGSGQTGTEYKEPITLTKSATVKAIAYVPEQYAASTISSAAFQRTTLPDFEADSEYSVSVQAEDEKYDIPGLIDTKAVAYTGGNGQLSRLRLTMLSDWSDNSVSALTIHQTENSKEESDLKEVEISPASGTSGYKEIVGTAMIDLPYADLGKNYTGTFTLKNGTAGSYTLTVSWDTAEKKLPQVKTPVFSPEGGAIREKTEVKISCETEGASIYYTTDGKTPTEESTLYEAEKPVSIEKTTTLKAIAVKEGMETSQEASAVYTWELLGGISKAELTQGEEYDTIRLYTSDRTYYDAVSEDALSATDYFIQASQGEKEEKFVYNGGIGGFTVQYNEETSEGIVTLNLDKEAWNTSEPLTLDIVMKAFQNKHLELDLSDPDSVTLKQKDTDSTASEGNVIPVSEMKAGNTYTATFKAYRIDNSSTESMLGGFFDKNVKLSVAADGTITASFYNTVYADSMLDFAVQGSEGTWKGAIKDGKREPEKDASGKITAAVYTLPVPSLSGGDLIAAVNVQAMGGSEAMNGSYDSYTQVKLVFDDTVTEGFSGFAVNNSGMTTEKIKNRALMTIKGMDADCDGYVSDSELQSYQFSAEEKSLDLSYSTVSSHYSVFDDFAMQDISWLKKLGDKSLESINLSGCSITELNDELKGFTKLTSLNLSANCISEIADDAFSDLSKLKDLKLSTNLLTSISKDLFSGLSQVGTGNDSVLDLSNNRISRIEKGAFDDMESITGVYLAENQMTSVSKGVFPQRKNFTWISLSKNNLTSVPKGLQEIPELDQLDLDKNQIAEIGASLDNLPSVTEINLSANLLDTVPESLISSNGNLTKLEVSKNSIITAPAVLLKKVAQAQGQFDSIFEYNAVDLEQCDLDDLSETERNTLREKAGEYPSKNDLGISLTAEEGTLSYTSELSGFDYWFWTLCKGGYVSGYVKEAVEKVLGKETVDTVEEFLEFRNANLPDFSSESIKNSILTDSTGTVSAFEVQTQLQELRNGTWHTLKSETVSQKEDAKSGSVKAADINEKGRYRLVKTVSNKTANLQHQIAVYSGQGDGTVSYPERELKDGTYSIPAEMFKPDRKTHSMSNNAIEHTAKLEVKDGTYYLTLDFQGMKISDLFGYLSELKYYDEGYTYGSNGLPQGDLVSAQVLSTQKNKDGSDVIDEFNDKAHLYPDQVKFRLVPTAISDKDGYVPLQVFVPIMDSITPGSGTQDVLLKLDWSGVEEGFEDSEEKPSEDPKPQKPPTVKVPAVSGVKVSSGSYNTASVTWKKVSGVSGYEIYRTGGGKTRSVKISAKSAAKLNDKGLKTGTRYTYKVRAYKVSQGITIYGDYSKAVSVKPALKKTRVSLKSKKRKVTIRWKKVDGASGYQIYRSQKKSRGYKRIKTITKGRTVKYTTKKMKKGKRYYYKVRAYRKVGGKKVYSAYSAAKRIRVK